MNKSEFASSSTLRKKERTEIGKLVKAMAPLCYVYDVDFRNLVAEQEPAVREKLTGKLFFVLANLSCNIQRDKKDANADYNMFSLNDMKDMAKALREFMMPGAHGHKFCSAPQFALW